MAIPIPSFSRRQQHPAAPYQCQHANTGRYTFLSFIFYHLFFFLYPSFADKDDHSQLQLRPMTQQWASPNNDSNSGHLAIPSLVQW